MIPNEFDEIYSLMEKEKPYGVYLGRFQPLHKGHQEVIDTIITNNLEPLILVGSINKNNEKNPLSFEIRKEIILENYPNEIQEENVVGVPDADNWDNWWDTVLSILKEFSDDPDDFVFVTHKKEEDKQKFTFKGKEYFGHYQDIFEMEGYEVMLIPESKLDGEVIHATKVRENREYAKKALSHKTFKILDSMNFWKTDNKLKSDIFIITGNIGSGKSTILKELSKLGKRVINADTIGQKIYNYKRSEIKEKFGTWNRKKIRKIIFNDEKAKKELEDLILPSVRMKILDEIENAKILEEDLFIEIPTYFESGLNNLLVFKEIPVILAYAPKEVCLERAAKRDNSNKEEIEKIYNQQIDIELKKKVSDIIIETDVKLKKIKKQIKKKILKGKKK